MKTLLILLLVASSAFAAEIRDGSDWAHMPPAEKQVWALGWMDGVDAAQRVLVGFDVVVAYRIEIQKFEGLTTDELVQGIDQFYAADYRNTPIGMGDAAMLAARYSRAGMGSKEVVAMIQTLRKVYTH